MFELDLTPIQRNEALASRRFGQIIYTQELLEDGNPIIQKMYSRIIPTRIDHDYLRGTYTVQAISPEFDPLDEHASIPFYCVLIKKTTNKQAAHGFAYRLTFQKVEA